MVITKYLVFDFGGTLADYKNLPKAWNGLYGDAFCELGKTENRNFTEQEIQKSIEILTKYNARINPRKNEISDEVIFGEINQVLKIGDTPKNLARRFYSYFQEKLVVYEETKAVLESLKKAGCKIGVLSDLPTAMPHETFLEDIGKIGFEFDTVQSSQSVGWRKPCVQGITKIAEIFGCEPYEITYVGDEKKDIELINKVSGCSVLINRDVDEKDFNQKMSIRSLVELLNCGF
ncbi:MAG: HAD family hydrolase [Treponema sp.]|nr:HAD family hydrolase [Treponema sp.]